MAEPFGSGASASSSALRRGLPRVVAGSLLVLQMAAPVAPDRGSRVHSQSAEDRRASVQVEQARGSSPDFRSRSEEPSALSVLRSGSTAAQEAPVGSSPGAQEVVYAWASDRLDYSVVSREERQELAVILDSMLISEKRDTGVPFEERIGHVDDPRVRELMQEIDTTLGGGIQWPDVHVTDGLSEANYLGFYYPDATQEEWSDFHDFDEPDGEFAEYPVDPHEFWLFCQNSCVFRAARIRLAPTSRDAGVLPWVRIMSFVFFCLGISPVFPVHCSHPACPLLWRVPSSRSGAVSRIQVYTGGGDDTVGLHVVQPAGRWHLVDPVCGQPVYVCPACWPAIRRVLPRAEAAAVRQVGPRPRWAQCAVCDPDLVC